ncbi:glycosyltransferase family 4 protein [Erwinia tracheiphila]|uniref:Glycosyltransferase family 1 protein n=1 Tax=Erwinia tracheiphila TaxID=65700 RepID=A0A345CXL0_9GAMM|nr:glycosyltransferase family 4 protein [Erwinia tracheiphila]AXF78177.1 glycosyltransferase family 1 protein [Erwinia tracheiphila]UIA83105.1 glycosyltransferase family 4 protein [Erwinia tracheiphila]UIA91683.1 glycosyltransferase family 4 protein [Erwinia tracheiphila]
MNKVRLAIVRQKYRPDGGAERFIARALEALDDDRLELNIITRSWQGEPKPGWHLHICNPEKWGRISRERGFAVAARACWQREQFDIVQSHERIAGCDIFRAGDGVHRVWLKQRARILSPVQRLMTRFSFYHRYVMKAEKTMFRAPSLKKIICNSLMVKQDIMSCFQIPEEKFAVIYNAIDAQRFTPATPEQRQQSRKTLGIRVERKVFIYVGSGFERKGLKASICALAATDMHLLVVGQDKQQPHYVNLARRLGCASRVHFLGVQHNVIPFYHAADCLILPTLYDPFPNVILEAMACGLPVITSFTCGGAEFIVNGEQGFVCDALDIPALTAAAAAIPLKSSDSRMGDAARLRILPCSPQHLAKELHDLYQQVLQSP